MVALRIRPAIVLFGDSITQQGFGCLGVDVGWASLLASDYPRSADVLNRGYSGYNTKMAVDLLPSIFPTGSGSDQNVLFCTVFFGANDAALPGERQHVPLEDYAKNLATIVNTIRGTTTKSSSDNKFPIILITPPPFDPAAWRKTRDLEVDGRANEVARSYAEQVQAVGTSHDCSVLNVWDLLEGGTSPEVYGKYLSDGLHLNEDGNRKVHEGLVDLIRREYPHLAPMEEGSSVGIPLEGKLWEELC